MDLKLADKTAVVTGASRGIGLAVSRSLADEGVRVLGVARTISPELEKIAAETVRADLSTTDGIDTLVAATIEEFGGTDILINNVGGGDADRAVIGGFLEIPDEQWQQLFDLNLFGIVRTTRGLLPGLIERRGVIINVSSINSRQPAPAPSGYSEAKAALTALGKRLSEEFGPRGVRVNTVSPGAVGTSLWRGADSIGAKIAAASGISHEQLLAGLADSFGISTGRITEPEEVASLITYLASDLSANLIGADVVIDGGTLKAV